jgi:hypothetical protein
MYLIRKLQAQQQATRHNRTAAKTQNQHIQVLALSAAQRIMQKFPAAASVRQWSGTPHPVQASPHCCWCQIHLCQIRWAVKLAEVAGTPVTQHCDNRMTGPQGLSCLDSTDTVDRSRAADKQAIVPVRNSSKTRPRRADIHAPRLLQIENAAEKCSPGDTLLCRALLCCAVFGQGTCDNR